ncbi:MAG: class E sortase [Aeromicrobium erythreum]
MTATEAPTAPAPPPRRRGRVRRWIGILLILAGLALLGYFAWQYWGTNVVSKARHADEKKIIAEDWGKGIDGKAIGLLRVPRFGADYEVPIVRGFSKDALASGVGWYTKGAKPGQVGNFVLAGHRVTHGEPFRDFLELRKGDTAIVETRTRIYTYRLRNDGDAITVPFTESWPLWPVPDPKAEGKAPTERLITLLTCSELFHTDNRNVVVGELVKTVDKADPEGRG